MGPSSGPTEGEALDHAGGRVEREEQKVGESLHALKRCACACIAHAAVHGVHMECACRAHAVCMHVPCACVRVKAVYVYVPARPPPRGCLPTRDVRAARRPR